MTELLVTPFVPGIARGILCHTSNVKPDSILLLTQQELTLFKTRPAGFIVVDGALFSHPMIRLFGMGIPAVMVSEESVRALEEGSEVLVDGTRGRIVWPAHSDSRTEVVPDTPSAGEQLKTTDGVVIELRASASSTEAAARALAKGASAIGLVRSEFLLPRDASLPDSAFFKSEIAALCDKARPLAVTLRLLDIAADKQVPWLSPIAAKMGTLGLQGPRLYDRESVRSVLHAMLDAVDSLTDRYQISLLIPYIVNVDEYQRWRSEIEAHVHARIDIGVMAETPAALLLMQDWFDVADFVSIGCNDLMQCLFAADRDLAEVSELLDPYAPVLFRFLRQAADAAGANLEKVQLCGMLPQLPGILPVLFGMGFTAFSVEPMMIPYLAKMISAMSFSEAQGLARQVCAAKSSREVRELLGLSVIDM